MAATTMTKGIRRTHTHNAGDSRLFSAWIDRLVAVAVP